MLPTSEYAETQEKAELASANGSKLVFNTVQSQHVIQIGS